ncbi:hypothetical protein TVAG_371990 [Trichomonas vaginalis G3]|uniref:Uncharacterized protein n=1 Tax=Trichomonas vaginalis (strain ATCC PRA-98 / G3) TaxID=412133 RepID=A2E0X0_TRIV3|nr:VPS9 domain family [Trichomonas vaginalis G3]EAY13725.1 hypothetical protein TVAG_371990 [Trichomonas vaginalis G3]KAI5529657.1 VPS9 domain family [Trichomonas vaginalis G3]|eukprot:XP_001325948.1 hypothetical protein [Trichomonas vaginalis G3]
MSENKFQFLFDIQKRIKHHKLMLKELNSAINPELQKYDEEISEYFISMQASNKIIHDIMNNSKGKSVSEILNGVQMTYHISEDYSMCDNIQKCVENSLDVIRYKAISDKYTSFCIVPSLFRYLWCKEDVESYLSFVFESEESVQVELIKCLITHPFIISYFRASLQPLYRKFDNLPQEQVVDETIKSLLEYVELIPDFFMKILKHFHNPRVIFVDIFLRAYILDPFLFGCCRYEFQLYHSDFFGKYFDFLKEYFFSEASLSFIITLLSTKSVLLSPSMKLFQDVTLEYGDRYMVGPEESDFLESICTVNSSNYTYLYKKQPMKPLPDPISSLPPFVDSVIRLLENSNMVLAEGNNFSKSAITQIVELGAPHLLPELDQISNDLAKLEIGDLCQMIEVKLKYQENYIQARIKDIVARYSSQSSLIRMYTQVSKSIIENAKVLAFLENPTDKPENINCSRAKVTVDLLDTMSNFMWETDLDKAALVFYNSDVIEDKDPFITKCKGKLSELKFFANELSLIVDGASPLAMADHIITAMGWLSEYIFSCGQEEAGADQIVPLTILAITVARPAHLGSLVAILDDYLMPINERTPIFSHTETFFVSTFIAASNYILDKAREVIENPFSPSKFND